MGAVDIGSASADLWCAWVGEHAERIDEYARTFLSDAEQEHRSGYRIRESAERYVVTRTLVRSVLGLHLRMPPREIEMSRTDTGKPIVAYGVHFNLSHSGDLILLAVSRTHDVGVDVERKREVGKVDALARRWLSDPEKSDVEAMRQRGMSYSDAFLRIWSLKEARLKALGVGISGSSRADLTRVSAMPLDQHLESLVATDASCYVGAIAFA